MVHSKNETRWRKQTQDITIFLISIDVVNIQNKKFESEVCVSVLFTKLDNCYIYNNSVN